MVSLELNTYIAIQNERFVHPGHQSLKNTYKCWQVGCNKKGRAIQKKRTREHTFQPSSSSKWEVYNKLSIFRRWHHGCEIFRFQTLGKPEKCTLQDLLLSQVIPESWILHCLCENFPEYPPDIIIQTSIIVYLIFQRFSWFKNYKLFY